MAVKEARGDIVLTLLRDYRADPNLSDAHQWSPLMFATVQKGAAGYEILKLLIDSGSELNQSNRDGMTAAQLAEYLHNERSSRYLQAAHRH